MPGSTSRIRVLLVDDHRLLVESLASMLAEHDNIEVVGLCGTVAEELAAANRHRPDVVLQDIMLPDGDGIDACRALKASFPGMQVLMLTAVVDEHVLSAAIGAGCAGYITKDVSAHDLVVAVRAAAVGEIVVSPTMLRKMLPLLRRSTPTPTLMTEREHEILVAMADGHSNREIAEQLRLSVNTIRNNVQDILTKLDTHSKLEAVAEAVRRGIIGR